MRTTLRLPVVQPGCLLRARIVTLSEPLAEVVVILLQTVERVQLAVTVLVCQRGKVGNTEVDADTLIAGRLRYVNFHLTDEVEFPFIACPNRPHLLDVLHGREVDVGPSLEFTENEIRPVFFEIRSFRESDAVVLSVEFEASGFERDRRTRMFVVAFAVTGGFAFVSP